MTRPPRRSADLTDPLHGGEQFAGDPLGLVAFSGQVEGAGWFGEDAGPRVTLHPSADPGA